MAGKNFHASHPRTKTEGVLPRLGYYIQYVCVNTARHKDWYISNEYFKATTGGPV